MLWGSYTWSEGPTFYKGGVLGMIVIFLLQCLGSGSVESPRFGLLGSGSEKLCGSIDPDPRGKISTKNAKKNLLSKLKSELLKKEGLKTNF